MKKITKRLLGFCLFALSSVLVFADPPKKASSTTIDAQSLSVVEAFQNTFRSISGKVLPTVVEVNVTETKTYVDPFEGFSNPFDYFFGNPNQDNSKSNQKEYETKGLGSGVIVRKTGNTYYVLTNNHVAGTATKISVTLNDDREFTAKLVGADSRLDIALVSFESTDKNIPIAELGDSDSVMTGDLCMAFGAPLGYDKSVTQGIISAVGRSETNMSSYSDYIQTDAAINQGNSGGPLVNIYGQVIGINTWIASQSGGSQGLGFAIPINNIKAAIDSFIKNGKVTYGWVGISLVEVNDDFKKELGVEGMEGAFAAEVYTNSPAFKAGIKPGDFIVEINGKKIKNTNQVIREVGALEAGSTARFVVYRGGKQQGEITVKVEERLEDSEIQSSKLWPGFIANPLTDQAREQLKIDDKKVKGVVVSNITDKSPAASLRLQTGDVITAVNGKAVKNVEEFYTELANAQKSVNFDVYSSGGTITTGTYRF